MVAPIVNRLRHPNETGFGAAMYIFGGFLWLFLGIGLVAELVTKPAEGFTTLSYMAGFVLFTVISSAMYRAHAYGHFVLLGPDQFPHLHRMVEEGAAELGLSPAPKAFLYNSNGLVNAFARRILGGRFIFLTSALVELETDPQVKFVIGHELGHHAAGHLNWVRNLLKLPAHFVPFLAPAYSRGRELTCDRIGAYLSEDRDACRSALQMLACGCRRLNSTMSCDAFEAQESQVPAFTGWLGLIFSHYPRTTQRVIAISEYFQSGYLAAQMPERHRETV